MKNFGYACINQGFSTRPKSRRITTNRTMIKRTFHERGIVYASELALQNLRDLRTILEWNLENDIYFFRISSDIIPWASEYDLRDMPNYGAIHAAALSAGNFARQHGMRITSHPGPFNKLASPKERVYQLTATDLTVHADLFDLIGLPHTPNSTFMSALPTVTSRSPLTTFVVTSNACQSLSALALLSRTTTKLRYTPPKSCTTVYTSA